MFKILIKLGANPQLNSRQNISILEKAIKYENIELAKIIKNWYYPLDDPRCNLSESNIISSKAENGTEKERMICK